MYEQDNRRLPSRNDGTQPGQNRQPPGQQPRMRSSQEQGAYGRGQEPYAQDRYTSQDRYNASERYGPPVDRYYDRNEQGGRYESERYDQRQRYPSDAGHADQRFEAGDYWSNDGGSASSG